MNEDTTKTKEKISFFKKLIILITSVIIIGVFLFLPILPIQRPVTYIIVNGGFYIKNSSIESEVVITNTDKYGGIFIVIHELVDCDLIMKNDTFYLEAGKTYYSRVTYINVICIPELIHYDVTPPCVTRTIIQILFEIFES